jgi:hypothetical protein
MLVPRVIVYFSCLWNFRLFSEQTPVGRPPTSFSHHSNLVQMPLFFSLVVFQGRINV